MTLTRSPSTSLVPPFERRRPHALRLELPKTLALRHAGSRECTLRAELVGPRDAPVVLALGGISADAHVSASRAHPEIGWWEPLVGPGRAIDTARFAVLSLDWLGADGQLDAPIDTRDQAAALCAVLDHLGVARAAFAFSASYGAMVALQLAAHHPERIGHVVAISATHRPHPYASAWRAIQRRIVALGRGAGCEREGVALARQLGMLSYRAPEEFAERFADAPTLDAQRARVASEDYLEACGARYAGRWPATAFVRLSESIDLHAVDPAAVRAPITLVTVEGDRLSPPEDARAFAAACAAPCRVHVIRSRYGHDAFLKEEALLRGLFAEVVEGAALQEVRAVEASIPWRPGREAPALAVARGEEATV